MKQVNGYYWCKLNNKWDIFSFCNGSWYDELETPYSESDFSEIDPHIIIHTEEKKMKTEFRIIDCGYFADLIEDLELYRTLTHMTENGWNVVKIFEPMKYKNSEEYFSRVIFSKQVPNDKN